MPPDCILSFGPFRLDAANAQLWSDAQPIRLTAKALQVLSYLAERPGQLVTKDEVFGAVWPDTVVSDATLTSNIQAVRQALGDDPRSPQYIETVHRRGFRFIGEVVRSQQEESQKAKGERTEQEVEKLGSLNEALRPNSGQAPAGIQELQAEASSESPWIPASAEMTPLPFSPQNDGNEAHKPAFSRSSSHPEPSLGVATLPTQRTWSARSLVFMGLVLFVGVILTVQYLSHPSLSTPPPPLLPLPDKPSLIVLPFVNLSGDSEQEYFSDGLTEVLTGNLSRISSLFVIAHNSANFYKNKQVTVQEISREMGVRYVVEGSVQKANQRVRVAVQLIEATTGYHVWSEQYDRPLTDIFALQDEIVQRIVTTLKLHVSLQEIGFGVRNRTDNLEAYDAFLRGLEAYNRFTPEANFQARQLLEKAMALDPQYAEACVWLGETYWVEWVWRWNTDPSIVEPALALAQQALALDDALPSVHSLLSNVYTMGQQYDPSIAEGERAVALDPNNDDSYAVLAQALIFAGRPEEASKMMAQAIRLNPHYPFWYASELGSAYRMTGRYVKAIATQKEVLGRSPSWLYAHLELAVNYWLQWVSQQSPVGQTLESAVAEIQQALALDDSLPWNHIILGLLSLYQLHYDQAVREMERAVALAPTEAETHAGLAVVLSAMGKTEDALQTAEEALRLKPYVPDEHLANVGSAYALAGRSEEAVTPLKQYLTRYPNILPAHLTLVGVYSELGQDAEAQAEAAEVLRLNPKFSLEVYKQRSPIKDPAVLERHIAALRKAGLK
jgi:TolB-like protein/DNA-binding winged helix-turn-helix (wHTH) protein/Flp pilus assembly protein TadD